MHIPSVNAAIASAGVVGSGAANDAACRVCGCMEGEQFASGGFEWFDCERCSTIQKNISYEQYLGLNPSYDPGHFLDSKDKSEIEEYLDVAEAHRFLAKMVSEHLAADSPRPRTFLDVGSGMGAYMLAAQQLGFESMGFEPSADHARVAIEHFGLNVVKDYFSAEKVEGRQFDLIILSHVIEHIFNPREFIRELLSVLKPGGALVIVTPNAESLVAASTGATWTMLKPVDHVTMISKRAYEFFGLSECAYVRHSTSEYPFEFAAAVLSSLKSKASSGRNKARDSNRITDAAKQPPSPLRRFGARAKVLRAALSVASFPAHLIAVVTGRQACLNTVLVRKS